jgi:hypothetical protein
MVWVLLLGVPIVALPATTLPLAGKLALDAAAVCADAPVLTSIVAKVRPVVAIRRVLKVVFMIFTVSLELDADAHAQAGLVFVVNIAARLGGLAVEINIAGQARAHAKAR